MTVILLRGSSPASPAMPLDHDPARHPIAVLFDLDGTLVDTMPAFADLAAEVLSARRGVAGAWARARYVETSGIPFVHQLELITPGDPDNAAASADFEERKLAICRAVRMDARTVAGLEAMRALGIKLVVSSNTGQAVVDEFARAETFRFDLVLGFDPALGLGKGAPHVERAQSILGVTRADLLLVGDSLKDAELAEQCGIGFVGRVGTFRADDFRRLDPAAVTVRHIDELVGLFTRHMEPA
jgi:phosphoglycolate phosphatase-like HAD superfamily hydrolase